MTVKYTKGTIARNANVTSSVRQISIYDDGGYGVGLVPAANQPYIVATEKGDGLTNRTVLTVTAAPITVTDDAGQAQYGGIHVYTFPQGVVYLRGAMYYGSLTLGTTGTIIDAYTGVGSLGSVTASTGATLVSTEATWLQSTAVATAAAKVSVTNAFPVATQVTESGSRHYDGHTTAGPVYLNFAVADDATHTTATGSWTGTIVLDWSILGDF